MKIGQLRKGIINHERISTVTSLLAIILRESLIGLKLVVKQALPKKRKRKVSLGFLIL